jgi:hypothetical protein
VRQLLELVLHGEPHLRIRPPPRGKGASTAPRPGACRASASTRG